MTSVIRKVILFKPVCCDLCSRCRHRWSAYGRCRCPSQAAVNASPNHISRPLKSDQLATATATSIYYIVYTFHSTYGTGRIAPVVHSQPLQSQFSAEPREPPHLRKSAVTASKDQRELCTASVLFSKHSFNCLDLAISI